MTGDTATFGSLLIEEGPATDYENLGHTRTFIATGKRGAQYGCSVSTKDSRTTWHWLNLRSFAANVPFDLAQVNPATLIDG